MLPKCTHKFEAVIETCNTILNCKSISNGLGPYLENLECTVDIRLILRRGYELHSFSYLKHLRNDDRQELDDDQKM